MNETVVTHTVAPEYFGPQERRLLGCYHRPRGPFRERAALLLYPTGHEYVRCHRAFRRLADQLARGFAAFRFDYLGMGDSFGESDQIELTYWLEDVRLAVERVRSLSGARAIDMVGLRFGATLGMLSDGADVGFDRLVLWQPVLDGARFVQELRQVHDAFLASQALSRPLPDRGGVVEIMGSSYRDALIRELEVLDLRDVPIQPDRKVLLIDNTVPSSRQRDRVSLESIAARLRSQGVPTRYERQPDPEIWLAEPFKQLMPHESIRTIVTALTEDWT